MFEIQEIVVHELIPYLFSIGIICSLGYVYAAFLYKGLSRTKLHDDCERMQQIPMPQQALDVVSRHHWLTRKVKRKEAPEGDSDDYASSFGLMQLTKRGGKLWKTAMDSPGSNGSGYWRRWRPLLS